MSEIKAKKADVWWLVARAFPHYTGRKFTIRPSTTITFWDTNLSGGTRSQYAAVRLDRGDSRARVYVAPAPWANPVEGRTVEIPNGFAVVEHRISTGKDVGITVWVRPEGLALALRGGTGLEGLRQQTFLGTARSRPWR